MNDRALKPSVPTGHSWQLHIRDQARALVASGFAIPTLVITAYPDEGTRARAIKVGVV